MKERFRNIMNKVNAEGLKNEVAISMAALKQAGEGDEIVVLTNDKQVGWFQVKQIVTQRGCKGNTTLTLVDLASGDETVITIRTELPEGVARVRRVSAGINARSTRKLALTPVVATKTPLVQPEGEFENILDVDLPEDETSVAVDVAEAVEASADSVVEPIVESIVETTTETPLESETDRNF